MKSKLVDFACPFVVGSLSFWVPILLVRLVFGPGWGVMFTLLPLTVVLPVFSCFVLESFAEKWNRTRPVIACAMVTGIWATAAFWITLAQTFGPGEGFHMAGAWTYVGLMTAFFPLSALLMSTYDGSLFAVLLTSASLFVFALAGRTFQPFLSRCIIFGSR